MKKLKIPLLVICAVFTFLGSLALISALWYVNNFGDIGFSSIVFTLTTTKSNVETGIASSYLWKGLIPSIVLAVAVFSFLWCRPKTKITFKDLKKQKKRTLYPFSSGVWTTPDSLRKPASEREYLRVRVRKKHGKES